MNQRRGFTLVELLVATAVFTFGFTAAFGMFLAALRYRTLADDTIKLSLAASSLPEEIAIGKTGTPVTPPPNPFPPSQYVGDGLPVYAATPPSPTTSDDFLSYPSIPGTWYRVESCTDLLGTGLATTSTLHAQIVVLVFSQAQGTSLPLEVVWNRLRPRPTDLPGLAPADCTSKVTTTLNPAQRDALIDLLIRRGMAIRRAVVIVRRPAWMT